MVDGNKENIVIIGMPGCGKSTIGELISKDLNYKFYDMDDYIVKISGKTIKELFDVSEEHFREWETKACKELSKLTNAIIASGGGVVKKAENIDILRKSCTILFIDRPVEEIIKDIEVGTRPLLKDGPHKIYNLYNERYELYKKAADKIVENKGTLEKVVKTCEDILK
ncbi:shikimate kinase [uncultured Clostridium sp.]|uniref:shikimate kinase n=1 Tax=uncultured Clostridium sp. TaxID=59620 RepID=UPI0025E8FFC4|nr:shikimate kinase [uncultured Clostridium sp.]